MPSDEDLEPFGGGDKQFAEFTRRSPAQIRLSDMDEDRKLLEQYREAWTDFEACVQKLQARKDGSEENLNRLFLEVEAARLKYSSARDRLVSRMLNTELLGLEPDWDEARIRGAAQLLWEFEGRPGDSAEKNWLCAEAMVRRAAAG